MDETSCCTNKRGNIVVPEGKYPFVSEERSVGHITMCCTSNAVGEALPPFIILPLILNLPDELTKFQSQCYFVSSPSGWMTSRIFTIWSIFFAAEMAKRRLALRSIYGESIKDSPCFLFLDGHKSRLNSTAIEILYTNNIRVIILPSHSSHITQPFDVALAAPFKSYLSSQSFKIPAWLKSKLDLMHKAAQNRYLMVITIIDAWKRASTTLNIKSSWEKTGLYPFNPSRVLASKYVNPDNNIAANSQNNTNRRNQIQINGMEITTFEKRLELSRHCSGNHDISAPMEIPHAYYLICQLRSTKERLLSHHPPILLHLGSQGYKWVQL